jgi:hypothetical protein
MSAPREAFLAGKSECDRLGRLLRAATGERESSLELAGQIALP